VNRAGIAATPFAVVYFLTAERKSESCVRASNSANGNSLILSNSSIGLQIPLGDCECQTTIHEATTQ